MRGMEEGKELLVVLGNDMCRFDDWLGATEHTAPSQRYLNSTPFIGWPLESGSGAGGN